jgi:hypothetical protein
LPSPKPEIARFLAAFKEEVQQGSGLYLVQRRENYRGLSELGLTKRNCVDEIIALSVSHYCSGPEPDRDQTGSVWVFGKQIAGREVYIKLKLATDGSKMIAKCISFHAAQYPLGYPYR